MTENKLYRCILDTPHGRMIAVATNKGLCALEFEKPDRNTLLMKRLTKWFSGYEFTGEGNRFTKKAATWLKYYFSGRFDELEPPDLDLRGTEFELRVWSVLRQIPLGQTITYGELARSLGVPGGARAVGNANRRNPVSLIVPCHRVIGQNKSLVGYGGGLEVKKKLISHES
jgi:O-6-methylguanine DNA methyltransferase